MTSEREKLEAILGGKLTLPNERTIPGLFKLNNSEARYFSVPAEKFFRQQFRKQFKNITGYTNPPIAQFGGVNEAGCVIKLPDGTIFYALDYHGDVTGWRKDIEEGAKAHNSLLAQIEDEKLKLNDGRVFSLSECEVRLY